MRYTIFFFILLSLFSCTSAEEETAQEPIKYEHPIPFEPETYACFRAAEPLIIDGNLDEASWEKAIWTNDFVDIQGMQKSNPPLKTSAKMLWDETYFYFAAELEEPHIWAKLTERDAIMYFDDDFEIFIDPDGDAHNYYEFEMNANNAIWDLLMLRPYRTDTMTNYLMNWEIKGIQTAVGIKGTLNDASDEDEGWIVEVAFPWSALMELAPERRMPKAGEQWRVNFSRVDWHMEVKDGQYEKILNETGEKPLPEENWVWSPTGFINMHMPEAWGFVSFFEEEVGTTSKTVEISPDEQIKWALWQLYYEQKTYREQHGEWAGRLDYLAIPAIEIPNYSFQPGLQAGKASFEITASAIDPNFLWVLDSDSQIRKLKR